jgi:hypothetical protein
MPIWFQPLKRPIIGITCLRLRQLAKSPIEYSFSNGSYLAWFMVIDLRETSFTQEPFKSRATLPSSSKLFKGLATPLFIKKEW